MQIDLSGRYIGGRAPAGTSEQGNAWCNRMAVHMEKCDSDCDDCGVYYNIQTVLPVYLSTGSILFRIQQSICISLSCG